MRGSVVALCFALVWGIVGCGGEDPTGLRRTSRTTTNAPSEDMADSDDGSRGDPATPEGAPGTSSPATPAPGGGSGAGPAGPYAAELQACVDAINGFRAQKGLAPLQRSAAIEAFSAKAAASDAASGRAHGYFAQTRGGGVASAENEVPGWPMGGGVKKVVEDGARMMFDEGPGGGHYENIVGRYTQVGCGIAVTPQNRVWVTQDFR
jgi:uncharacterized protein YkwD